MALITKTADVHPDAFSGAVCPVIPSLVAGEAINAGADCYIKVADGKVYMSIDTAVFTRVFTEAVDADGGTITISNALVHGFAPKDYAAGDTMSLYGKGCILADYSTGMSAGTALFVSGTKGVLSDAAIVVGDVPCALAINSTDIIAL